MRTFRLGAVFGSLCLLGSCVPVDGDPPVQGSKQLQQLSSHEIVAVCDWATDYMGGRPSNPDNADIGGAIVHRCPGDIGIPTEEQDNSLVFVSFDYKACPGTLAGLAQDGCTLTVNDFAGWIEAIGDTPCEHHYVNNGQCALIWTGAEDAP